MATQNYTGTLFNQLGGYQPSSPGTDITQVVSNVLGIITVIAGLSFIFYFMIGAINWITSGGDPQKTQSAQQIITNSLIGLAISVAAYPIAQVLSRLLGAPLTNPAELFSSFIF